MDGRGWDGMGWDGCWGASSGGATAGQRKQWTLVSLPSASPSSVGSSLSCPGSFFSGLETVWQV